MWRSVGTVNPQEPKSNRSRDQGNYEPFAQASRLKLNQSQLSGDNHSRFMGEYFGKKRVSEGTLQRVLSQKQIQPRLVVSPPSSLREVNSPRFQNINNNSSLKQVPNNKNLTDSMLGNSLQGRSLQGNAKIPSVSNAQLESLRGEINKVKLEQLALKKKVVLDLEQLQREIKGFQGEVNDRLLRVKQKAQKEGRQGVNPELLLKIRQENTRFGQKMKQMDSRKEQIRQKYRNKLQEL